MRSKERSGTTSWAPALRGLLFCTTLLLSGLAVAGEEPAAKQEPAPEDAGGNNRIVREGIAIEFAMERVATEGEEPPAPVEGAFREGDVVRFRFQITDTNSDTPLSGVFPAAWMDLRAKHEDDVACKDKVEAFIGGSLLSPPELDLNVYYVLAMNNDASISVVDPLFGFGNTKLLDMIFLKSPGEDWALTSDQMTLFVSMPESDQVAVADTATWEVATNLRTGPHPSRVALQADEHYLWVGYDAPREGEQVSGLTVIDTDGPSVVKTILTGRGHHEIAFSPDDRFAFVTNEGEGTLSILDVRSLERIGQLDVGGEPASVAYSAVGGAAYVTSRGDGAIVVVDGTSHEITARIQAQPGLGQIRFAPDGRLAFVVNPEKNTLQVIDAAVNRIIQSGDVEEGPDQVAFSDHLAYIRHRGSELVLMVPLEQVGREGAPIPVIDFPGGQQPFGRTSRPSRAAAIVQAPGATAVLVANAGDRTIYYYKEGMAAPMGHFQNYSREPRAVLAVDRSLGEKSPGSYETVAGLRTPGLYDVAFFLDSPRTVHCFPVEVAPNPVLEAARLREHPVQVEPIRGDDKAAVGREVLLRFRLTDSASGEPRDDLGDVRILTFRAPGVERQEHAAMPMGDGAYGVRFVPDAPGVYYAFLGSSTAHVQYNGSPFLLLRVGPASPAEDPGRRSGGAVTTLEGRKEQR